MNVRTQREQIAAKMRGQWQIAILTASFGVLALVLAAIGIYGMLAYSVSRRTSEIGIRMALGARPRYGAGDGAARGGCGLRASAWLPVWGAAGLGHGQAGGEHAVRAEERRNPTTLVGSAVVLGLVALGASWIPARRAAGVDPMKALRHE